MIIEDFVRQAELYPNALAVEHAGIGVDYSTLLGRSSAFARRLNALGIGHNDRVALALPKSIEALACLIGVMMTGAAYVPLDAGQPEARIGRSLHDCEPRAIVTTPPLLERLLAIEPSLQREIQALITHGTCRIPGAIEHDFRQKESTFRPTTSVSPDSPAYILYTSGSTGEPKGVVHSVTSAAQFVNWAVRTFRLDCSQVLANFAQFSFDLSILDLFGALTTGASVHLVQAEMLLRPKELVKKLDEWGTTLLYAVPSAISLLESDGNLVEHAPAKLARVLYAGEPFAVRQLTRVMNALPQAKFFNLYGPTETNVCTYHSLSGVPGEGTTQIPIGKACEHLTVEVLDDRGQRAKTGDEGEVCVAGPSVMSGYFRRPDSNKVAFFGQTLFPDARVRYRTGDRAQLDQNGLFWFLGRRDRLVKKRGYRIELGEIEVALSQSSGVREAVAFGVNVEEGIRVNAAVVLHESEKPSILTLKAQCGRLLPPYMVPDSILILPTLPRTPNGKVDLMRLRKMSAV
jgi:amino acid adenylation domain-containing protein